jgi:hypothetical protein
MSISLASNGVFSGSNSPHLSGHMMPPSKSHKVPICRRAMASVKGCREDNANTNVFFIVCSLALAWELTFRANGRLLGSYVAVNENCRGRRSTEIRTKSLREFQSAHLIELRLPSRNMAPGSLHCRRNHFQGVGVVVGQVERGIIRADPDFAREQSCLCGLHHAGRGGNGRIEDG